ncbi:MAG: hypothetical protein IT373_36110 [Polyangiaceae bacterium]|nr:hypothetical protein [Polyangiaceae bacterium]
MQGGRDLLPLRTCLDLLGELLDTDTDEEALLSALFTCERAMKDFSFGLGTLGEVEARVHGLRGQVPRALYDELEGELAWLYRQARGTALEARLTAALSELSRHGPEGNLDAEAVRERHSN